MKRGDAHPWLHTGGLLLAAIVVLPIVFLVWRAGALGPEVAARVLTQPETLWSLLRSLALGVGVAALCVGLSVPMAWLCHATDLPGRRAFQILLNLPLAVPSYVAGFVVVAVFGPRGWLQQVLSPLGVERLPEIYGWTGATLALLYAYPYALLPLQAALSRMDPAQWEAARMLGSTPRSAFRQVVLPQLRPSMAVGGLLVALYVLSDFGAVSLLRFRSLSYVIYLRYRSLFDRDEAVVLGILLAAVALAVVWLQRRVQGRARPPSSRGGARRWPVVSLGAWRWPAFAFCLLATIAGVGLPVFVVLLWLSRGAASVDWSRLATVTASTIGLGVSAAVVTLLAALLPALLARFGRPSAARGVHVAAHAGYALPGIVVALALVFFTARNVPLLYQTLPLLVLAYVVRFLPLALGAVEEGLQAQRSRLYEAARTLGCTPTRAWIRVVLPAARVAMWAGLLAVFLSVVKELPATLLLSPIGLRTLATQIWALTEDAYFAAAAPPILILLLLGGAVLALRPDSPLRSKS